MRPSTRPAPYGLRCARRGRPGGRAGVPRPPRSPPRTHPKRAPGSGEARRRAPRLLRLGRRQIAQDAHRPWTRAGEQQGQARCGSLTRGMHTA
eukprot:7516260-Alexandrium_andersonii.AAC.1